MKVQDITTSNMVASALEKKMSVGEDMKKLVLRVGMASKEIVWHCLKIELSYNSTISSGCASKGIKSYNLNIYLISCW